MKNLLPLFLFTFVLFSCKQDPKESITESGIADKGCVDCPPPITLIVPDELKGNQEAELYISDAETMFNKWSDKSFVLAKELKISDVDTTKADFSESMRKGRNALKIMSFLSEFLQDTQVMNARMEKMKENMTQEEIAAFDEVWEQLEGRLEEIEDSFESIDIDIDLNKESITSGNVQK